MSILRRIISVFVAIEMLFSGIFAGGFSAKVKMPAAETGEYTQYVDPFIGTGGIPWACAMLSPAATVPFGCVRLGPDTAAVGGIYLFKTNTSGYFYEHRHILGFSYSRLSGTGIMDYGMFRVTPFNGKKPVKALSFSHSNETASPGYYAVYLPGASALCEMTATGHTGYQRYTFGSKGAKLSIDAASHLGDGKTENAVIKADDKSRTITAQVTAMGGFSGRYKGLDIYYYAECDTPFTSALSDDGTRVELDFGKAEGKPVTLRAGISFVSTENAKQNLYAEAEEKDFDTIRSEAVEQWERRLGTVKISADKKTKTKFYTALYHAMIMPTDFTDSNGEYVGFDKAVHKAEGFTYRTDMSLWDTCRNVHSLYALIAPDIQKDCLESLLLMADRGGTLPRWPQGEGYTGSMFGNPANIVFTESMLKGFKFDAEKAYSYMKKSTDEAEKYTENREWASLYNEYGYIPDDLVRNESRSFSVSRAIEYSWDDAAISVMAKKLGYDDEAEYYAEKSMNYKNLWDSETKYFRPRNADGSFGKMNVNYISFYDDILGTDIAKCYCEGGARHWRWGALHDTDSLIELFGSKEYFTSELEDFMKDASLNMGAINPGPGFWIGNQHDIHTPYLFNCASRPDLTQKWVRWSLDNRFNADVNGLDGNDDGGTISTWYVFSAMGFYPIAGSDEYWVGSPCIDSAEITLGNGKTLKITVNGQNDKNIYVNSVTVNGSVPQNMKFNHSAIENGGEIVFNMSSKPAAQ